MAPNGAQAPAAKFPAQPVRDIVLHRTPNASQVVAAAYSQPNATDLKRATPVVGSTANLSSTLPSLAAIQPAGNPAIPPSSTTTDRVIAAICTEPIVQETEEFTLHLETSGDMPSGDVPSQLPNVAVKFLKSITEPTCETIAGGHPAAGELSSENITISSSDDEHVERIIITSPSFGNTQSVPATQSNDTSGTIRIRTSSDQVERIPVKAINSNAND
jgi:hypothetical protein